MEEEKEEEKAFKRALTARKKIERATSDQSINLEVKETQAQKDKAREEAQQALKIKCVLLEAWTGADYILPPSLPPSLPPPSPLSSRSIRIMRRGGAGAGAAARHGSGAL
jgi:hypothetical protein